MSTAPALPQEFERRWARALLEERMARDPLRAFVPHPRQGEFIRAVLESSTYETWAICSNRWGKSDALAYCVAKFFRYGVEPTRPSIGGSGIWVWDRATSGWVIGPDYQTMEHTVIPKMLDNGLVPPGAAHGPFIPSWEVAHWNNNTLTAKGTNGSLLQCKSNDQRALKFAAAGVDYVGFDEEPEYVNYEEATLRVEAGRRLRIFGACTLLPPENQPGGVSWLYGTIIQPFLDGKASWQCFGGSIYDNPHILSEEIDRLEAKYPLGSAARRIRLGGEWIPGVGGARIYGNFSRAVHVKPQGPVNQHLPLCWYWDFNVSPLCSGVGQRGRDRIFHLLREFVLDEGSIPDMCQAFTDAYPRHGHELWIYGDASNPRSVHTRTSDYQLILNEMRQYPSPVRLKIPEANPYVNDRVNSVNTALKDEFGESHVEIDPSMLETIADFEQVLSDGRGGIKKVSDTHNPYSRRTHASDAVGYYIYREAPLRSTLPAHQYGQQVRMSQPQYGRAR